MEIGLFGWMAIGHFAQFPHEIHLGMCLGFATLYPINWWLIRRGVKEAM